MKGYGNVFIKVIISNEENKFGDAITKIITILNITFYFFFIHNIVLFQKL